MSMFPILFNRGSQNRDLLSTFDYLFDDMMNYRPTTTSQTIGTVPRANIIKNDDSYTIELAAPGLTREEFVIDYESGNLSISVSTEDSQSYKDSVTMREYSFSSFKRSWSLPENTNPQGITARYDAGILYVEVPVEGTKNNKRSISVE